MLGYNKNSIYVECEMMKKSLKKKCADKFRGIRFDIIGKSLEKRRNLYYCSILRGKIVCKYS